MSVTAVPAGTGIDVPDWPPPDSEVVTAVGWVAGLPAPMQMPAPTVVHTVLPTASVA